MGYEKDGNWRKVMEGRSEGRKGERKRRERKGGKESTGREGG